MWRVFFRYAWWRIKSDASQARGPYRDAAAGQSHREALAAGLEALNTAAA